MMAVFIFAFQSCKYGPQPIVLGKDACSYCKMGIADTRFGAEIITGKDSVFKFDDMYCLHAFINENASNHDEIKEAYLINFNDPHNFIDARKAFLLKSPELHSPMGGNMGAFTTVNKLKEAKKMFKGEEVKSGTILDKGFF